MSEADAFSKFPQRPLDRDGRTISAIIWEVDRAPSETDGELLAASRALDANWLLVPATPSLDLLDQWRTLITESDHLIIGVDSDDLVARRNRALVERLESLGRSHCDAVMLQDADTDSLKAGRPFHRLSNLRESGLTKFLFLDSPSAEVAEWITENTPAHAVAVPFDLADQTARYRLFDVAQEMGTKLLSRRAEAKKFDIAVAPEQELAFRFAEPHITAVIEPLPTTIRDVHRIANASTLALSTEQREEWWRQFQEKVPPPPKPKRGHPPEYGS
jgi:hypothetical protein